MSDLNDHSNPINQNNQSNQNNQLTIITLNNTINQNNSNILHKITLFYYNIDIKIKILFNILLVIICYYINNRTQSTLINYISLIFLIIGVKYLSIKFIRFYLRFSFYKHANDILDFLIEETNKPNSQAIELVKNILRRFGILPDNNENEQNNNTDNIN